MGKSAKDTVAFPVSLMGRSLHAVSEQQDGPNLGVGDNSKYI